jgi:large subunit ribosomal protein L21
MTRAREWANYSGRAAVRARFFSCGRDGHAPEGLTMRRMYLVRRPAGCYKDLFERHGADGPCGVTTAMYAIFEDGSRQYRASEGTVVKVDFRRSEGERREGLEPGARVEFPRVLLYRNGDDTRIGQPLVEGMRVLGEVVDHPSTKVYVGKYRRRKNYRRLRGHRQFYTAVKVKHILLPGQEAPAAPAAEPPATPEAPATS